MTEPDPKPPKKPVLPSQPGEDERPNRPIEPSGDTEIPIDGPPEEDNRRDSGRGARDTL